MSFSDGSNHSDIYNTMAISLTNFIENAVVGYPSAQDRLASFELIGLWSEATVQATVLALLLETVRWRGLR